MEPGNHHEVWEDELDVIPRVDEYVVLPDGETHLVHSVIHCLAADMIEIRVRP
jgi:hypothetical protein